MIGFKFPGTDESRFREQTNRRSQLAGSTLPSFVCPQCKEVRQIKGRKMNVPGYARGGYRCRVCVGGEA